MDLNHRLIEAVRQCPLLYKNNASLSDRRCGWQQIAQQMKMQEAILKTRWHFLREHYKRNVVADNQLDSNQFPYKKEMEFLLPYLRPPRKEEHNEAEFISEGIIKPEFVITEKDLENDSGNEEYVFLEVEALGSEYETSNVVTQQISENDLKKELQQEHEQQQDDYEAEELTHIEMEVHVKEEQMENRRTYAIHQADEEISKEATESASNSNGIKEDENVRSPIQEASEENKHETKVEVRESDSSSDNVANNSDRSEDAIFGELVSAMLKKMPAEKKRNIKRDIMNLLLT